MAIKNVHTTTMHAKCPINSSWDYYVVRITTEEFVKCEDVEKVVNSLRGAMLTQESIADSLADRLPTHCQIELSGTHGQNNDLQTFRWGTSE